ncbi:MAG: Di-glucose binding within endoplasmic reticulum [candidate division BRC1 bacterium ADurb.BinA364]|nr:MAG: Di-glucose binding within endoplasmic reticulum [candidate division BRC1 bacterium ADurb.BinA364]
MEFPSVGGPSPDIPVSASGEAVRLYRKHMSFVEPSEPQALAWVAASGLEGVEKLTARLFLQPAEKQPKNVEAFERNAWTRELGYEGGAPQGRFAAPARYTVRLHFAEALGAEPGERVFDVFIQGEKKLDDFDVAAAAGGAGRAIVREFAGVAVLDDLSVEFRPRRGSRPPIVSGLEIQKEEL